MAGPDSGGGGSQGWGAGRLRPQAVYTLALGAQFALLAYVIIPLGRGTILLVGLLELISILVRSRFRLDPRLLLVDCGLFCVLAVYEPKVALLLFVYAYYFAWHDKAWYALLPLGISLVLVEGPYRILPIQAVLIGGILRLWKKQSQALSDEADKLRHRLYRMEVTEERLLADYQSAARLSQLEERQRIAESLHDDLGHELTAAQLSVKSVGVFLARCDFERAGRAQEKAATRLDTALTQLKGAVKRLEPEAEVGLGALRSVFDSFSYPVSLEIPDDPDWLRGYHLQLLAAAAKEALTNVAKHAIPSRVRASIRITDRIVRLIVENDGVKDAPGERSGNGLRYMRRRLEAVHGSLSAGMSESKDFYRFIVILPREAS